MNPKTESDFLPNYHFTRLHILKRVCIYLQLAGYQYHHLTARSLPSQTDLFYLTFVRPTWSRSSPCQPGDCAGAGQHSRAGAAAAGRAPWRRRSGGGWWSRWSSGLGRTSSSGRTPQRKHQYQADCLKRMECQHQYFIRKGNNSEKLIK